MRPHEILLLALVAIILLLGLVTEGYASHGLPRAVAFLLAAISGAVGTMVAWNHFNGPSRLLILFFLIPITAGGLLVLPLPAGLVSSLSHHWSDMLSTRETVGLPPLDFIPFTLDYEASIRSLNLWIAAGALVPALLALCRSRTGMALLLYLVVAVGLMEGTLAFLNLLMEDGRARGGLFNPNHSAALILMTIPVATALVYRRGMFHGKREQDYLPRRINDVWILPLGFIGIAALGWLATVSRASIAIGLLVLLPWILWELRIMILHETLVYRRKLYVLLAGTFAMLLLVIWFAGSPEAISERMDVPDAGYGRVDLWVATWQGLVDSNFIGVGLGGANVALELGLQDVATRKSPGWTHNDWLQYVCDLGIVGVLLTATWIIAFGMTLRKTTVCVPGWWVSRRHMIDRAIIVGILTILIHSLVDFPLRITLVGFCFLALLAILLARLNPKEIVPNRATR